MDPVNMPVIQQAMHDEVKNYIGGNCTETFVRQNIFLSVSCGIITLLFSILSVNYYEFFRF